MIAFPSELPARVQAKQVDKETSDVVAHLCPYTKKETSNINQLPLLFFLPLYLSSALQCLLSGQMVQQIRQHPE